MLLDITIILIMIIAIYQGYERGLILTIFHTFGWLIAILLSLFLLPSTTAFLSTYSNIYENIRESLGNILHGSSMSAISASAVFPSAIEDMISNIMQTLSMSALESAAWALFTIFCFVVLVLLLRCAIHLIAQIFSKKKFNSSIFGGFNKLLGIVLGSVKGCLIVLIVLAIMMPLSLLISPSFNAFLTKALTSSNFAEIIYNSNPLLSIMSGFAL